MGNKQSFIQQKAKQFIKNRDNLFEELKIKIETYFQDHNLSQKQIDQIIDLTATQLVERLNKFQISSQDLVYIYIYRAITVGKQLNLVTQVDFETALRLAVECDLERAKSKKTNWTVYERFNAQRHFPPFYGIPISIKDIFDQKDLHSTIGIMHRIMLKNEKDSSIITCFRNSGLIPFVRTNVPQLGMIFDCNNFLWGRSLNVWNKERSVGGSSGGQAGMLTAKCSVIGLGSDIAGSLRIPAGFCGVFSLKPGQNRLVNCQTQWHLSQKGKRGINSVLGPMSRSVDDLALLMKIMCDQSFYKDSLNPYAKLHPFDQTKYIESFKNRNFKIGYIKDIKMIEASPSYHRAIRQTKRILEGLGHQLVQVEIPCQDQIIKQFFVEVSAQGNLKSYYDQLQGEKFIPEYNQVIMMTTMPGIIKVLVKNLFRLVQPRVAMLMDHLKEISVYEYFLHIGRVSEYRKKFVQYWKENDLDFIICPAFACPANLHGNSQKIILAAAYTFIWNMFDLPVGCMPITFVRQNQQFYVSKHNDMITQTLKQNAKNSKDLPIGIQIIGLPWRQEDILGLMKQIQYEKTKFQ